jgi:hypothetical protein
LPFLKNLAAILKAAAGNRGIPELRQRVRIWRIQQFERGLPAAGKRKDFVPGVAIEELLRHIP